MYPFFYYTEWHHSINCIQLIECFGWIYLALPPGYAVPTLPQIMKSTTMVMEIVTTQPRPTTIQRR